MSSPNYSQFVARPMDIPDHHYGVSIPGTNGRDHWTPATNMNRINSNQPQLPLSNHNHHLPSSPPPSRPSDSISGLNHYPARDTFLSPHPISAHNQPIAAPQSLNSNLTSSSSPRTTLWWGDLEPWMDEEYARQVCSMMNWDPVNIKVPRPAADSVSGQHPNNPGYCFLTFSSQNQAASVLNQINNSGTPLIMPNSTKPFVFNWASAVPTSPVTSPFAMPPPAPVTPVPQAAAQQQAQFSKEYSIFVGDLAPEVSNSDLVAVFRNPVLGLRNDREPRFIRPFLSCKSAKIMLDPVTGVSRGYGFVRFTDETDQQRALIEMHGLYCLSRPMRISPATAKYKAQGQQAPAPSDYGTESIPVGASAYPEQPPQISQPISALPPHGISGQSVMSSSSSLQTGSGSTSSIPSLSSGHSSSSTLASTMSDDILKAHNASGQQQHHVENTSKPAANGSAVNSITSAFAAQVQGPLSSERYAVSEESWKHHAQARAILSNLIGPNGEQLSSSDPYNTTVFVGGLSPLISEDTLRTFFAPFGEIHYVKVPAGKNCGFVQFIRKPDAERAIEKMQGFPIGGSRIRLSWGRSQYKAAQAAAQAAQTAALHTQFPSSQQLQQPQPVQQQPRSPPLQPRVQSQSQSPPTQNLPPAITPEQALELVQKLGLAGYFNNPEPPSHSSNHSNQNQGFSHFNGSQNLNFRENEPSSALDMLQTSYRPGSGPSTIDAQIMRSQLSSFSPFSPDPIPYLDDHQNSREAIGSMRHDPLSKSYASAFGDQGVMSLSGKISPTSTVTSQGARSSSGSGTPRYGQFFEPSPPHLLARSSSRQDAGMQRGSPPHQRSPGRDTEFEQDSIHDLNGTLASLDLDNSQGSWRQILNGSSPSS